HMIRQVKPEVLAGFIDEAKGYLPHIQQALEAFRADKSRRDVLEDVYRPVHTIRGAAAMVGLSSLSHVAHQLELALDELALGQFALHEEFALLLNQVIGSFPKFLDGKSSDSFDEPSWLVECARLCRLLRAQPDVPDPGLDQLLEEIRHGCADLSIVGENEGDPTYPDVLPPAEFPDLPLGAEFLEGLASTSPRAEEEVAPELVEVFALEAEEHLRTI